MSGILVQTNRVFVHLNSRLDLRKRQAQSVLCAQFNCNTVYNVSSGVHLNEDWRDMLPSGKRVQLNGKVVSWMPDPRERYLGAVLSMSQ